MSFEKEAASAQRVGRPQKPINPDSGPRALLAQELRDLREACGSPTLMLLATYADVDHRRLGEAARDGSLPSWQVVEGYVRGCWDYFQYKHRRPFANAGDLAHWRQLYDKAGGSLPEESQPGNIDGKLPTARLPDRVAVPGAPTAAVPLALTAFWPQPPLTGDHRQPALLVLGAAAGILLMLGVIAGVYAGTGQPSRDRSKLPTHSAPDGRHTRIFVMAPAPACGLAVQDEFRSPATTAFTNITQVNSISLDGLSVTVMQGTYKGGTYDWLESHPTGSRSGLQLRWSSTPGHWHYCTATDEGGLVAALPDQVATIAVPAILHGKEVTFQACIWHQHPYTAQCSSLYKSLAAHHVNEAANAYRSMWPRRGAVTWESR